MRAKSLQRRHSRTSRPARARTLRFESLDSRSLLAVFAGIDAVPDDGPADVGVIAPDIPSFDVDLLVANLRNTFDSSTVGYSFVVNQDGQTVRTYEHGDAIAANDEGGPIAQTHLTRMNIASVSKIITTTAVLHLLEDEGISVDSPIGDYLPPSWDLGARFDPDDLNAFTFRHLLTHSTGITAPNAGPTFSLLQSIAETDMAPGVYPYQYSNSNFAMFRIIIPYILNDPALDDPDADLDALTSQIYQQYVQDNILEPMEIDGASCQEADPAPVRYYAFPHDGVTTGWTTGDWTTTCGGGGWYLSTGELGVFMANLAHNDEILSPETRQMMNQQLLGWMPPVGNFASFVNGKYGTYLTHGGDLSDAAGRGLDACIMSFPGDVQVALLTNSQGGNYGGYQCKAIKVAYENAFPDVYVNGTSDGNSIHVGLDPLDDEILQVTVDGDVRLSRAITTIDSLTVRGLGGNDTFTIEDLPSAVQLILEGGSGNDDFFLGTGDVDSHLLGPIQVNGGFAGTDALRVMDFGDAGNDSYSLHPTVFQKNTSTPVEYTAIEEFSLFANSGHNTIQIDGNVGVSVAILAGAGDDTVYGSNGPDTISGGEGADLLYGRGGADSLNGEDGNDTLVGGTGADTLQGGTNNDHLIGGNQAGLGLVNDASSDRLDGGPGDDWLAGDNAWFAPLNANAAVGGADELYGGIGNDTIHGQGGGDRIEGDAGADEIHAGGGADTVDGGTQADSIQGGSGNDSLAGGFGHDTIRGGTGRDSVEGGQGDDTLLGEADNDTLLGEGGNDDLSGGEGIDLLVGSFGADTIAGGPGTDRIVGGNLVVAPSLVIDLALDVLFGDEGDDAIFGDDGSFLPFFHDPSGGAGDVIRGGPGNDLLFGGGGGDNIQGNDGSDTIYAGDGNDAVIGGSLVGEGDPPPRDPSGLVQQPPEYDGGDFIAGGVGNDLVYGDDLDPALPTTTSPHGAADTLSGGEGNDTMFGQLGDDRLLGEDGNDLLSGGVGHDSVLGGRGEDELRGGTGNDTLQGESGDDRLWGEEGNDLLEGGSENDWISGADGQDTAAGGDGDDLVRGGDGDDSLDGGNGNDILLGENGNDILLGQAGRDFLIGGRNSGERKGAGDLLRGGVDDDLLIAGTTSHDANDLALRAVMAEWSSGRKYETRVKNLKGIANPLLAARLNGATYLTDLTVSAVDGGPDELHGDRDRDWLLLDLLTDSHDAEVGEQVN